MIDAAPTAAPARALLTVRGLSVGFPTQAGLLLAVHDIDLAVASGEVVGLVGESGSGKSMTCRAIMDLVPPPGAILSGQIELAGRDLLSLPPRERRRVRGREVAMVFQDPLSSLNPVFTVGHQIEEVLLRRVGMPRRRARTRAVELLDRVGIPSPAKRLRAYSHELSGGMRQRIMIALALAAEPRLLLADEPTTSLDVTIQDQILHLLLDLRSETGMSIVLVSHDMGVIAQTCDRVAVMYAGYIVEAGTVGEIFARPRHPYTRALLEAIPRLETGRHAGELRAIPGQPPDLARLEGGCPFRPRCPAARAECAAVPMDLLQVAPGHVSACPFEGGTA